jgi:hypothetical protein
MDCCDFLDLLKQALHLKHHVGVTEASVSTLLQFHSTHSNRHDDRHMQNEHPRAKSGLSRTKTLTTQTPCLNESNSFTKSGRKADFVIPDMNWSRCTRAPACIQQCTTPSPSSSPTVLNTSHCSAKACRSESALRVALTEALTFEAAYQVSLGDAACGHSTVLL